MQRHPRTIRVDACLRGRLPCRARIARPGPVAIALTAVLFATGGCGAPQARLAVDQPQRGGPERRFELTTTTAHYADAPDGVRRVRLAFPMPGAWSGRSFLFYLRVPAAPGTHPIGAPLPGGGVVGGFFIQAAGRNKGLTEFVSGYVVVSDVLGRRDRRRGRIDVRCADGTVLSGEFAAQEDALELRDFEERDRPGDVQALIPLIREPR